MNVCRHYTVKGQVQGVFYRASTRDQATVLGLNGWVRNLADGQVELLACGSEEQLGELEQWLWQGPPHARVAHIAVTTVPTGSTEPHTGFRIRY